jgi:hypothetical protein
MLKRITLTALFAIATAFAVGTAMAQTHAKGAQNGVVHPITPQGLCPKGNC